MLTENYVSLVAGNINNDNIQNVIDLRYFYRVTPSLCLFNCVLRSKTAPVRCRFGAAVRTGAVSNPVRFYPEAPHSPGFLPGMNFL